MSLEGGALYFRPSDHETEISTWYLPDNAYQLPSAVVTVGSMCQFRVDFFGYILRCELNWIIAEICAALGSPITGY